MIFSATITAVMFGVLMYTAFTNHPDTLYFAAFFFLMLDNLKKHAKIQLLELAYLKQIGEVRTLDQIKDYEITVDVKKGK